MSNAKQETIVDIVAEMRNGPCCWLTLEGIPQNCHDNELFYKFADRIEAAWKRERNILMTTPRSLEECAERARKNKDGWDDVY